MAQQVAYTDTVSNLPNMRAALINLEEVLQNARTKGQPFSILLIDGDNLRAANLISYAAGDEIIPAMGTLFQQNLRPGDYVARWRMEMNSSSPCQTHPTKGQLLSANAFD